LSVEKKLSIAALSQQLPRRLMLQTIPWDSSRRWKTARRQHCFDWGKRDWQQASALVQLHGAQLAAPPEDRTGVQTVLQSQLGY